MYTIKNFNKGYLEYSLVLDQTVSTPANMVTLGQTVTQQELIDFFGAYPVLLKSGGSEEMKLKKTNLQQLEDGTSASSYTASTDWDVMVKFPRRGYKISTTNNVTTITVTDNPHNEADGFVYYPFQRIKSGKLGASDAVYVDVDAFYLGAYKGVDSSGLRSWYNQTPTASQTIGTFAGYARTRGNNYGITEFVQETYLELMYLFIFKNTNAQAVLGRGYVDGGGSSYPGPKTGANTYNLIGSATLSGAVEGCYGTSGGTTPMVFMWLEHWYGGVWEWVHGRGQDSNSKIHISIPNSDGSNRTSSYFYTPGGASSQELTVSLTNGAYITKVKGDNIFGFTATNNSGGGDSSYFTDSARWGSGARVAIFGGAWHYASGCGAFCWYWRVDASHTSADVGARLMYLPNS